MRSLLVLLYEAQCACVNQLLTDGCGVHGTESLCVCVCVCVCSILRVKLIKDCAILWDAWRDREVPVITVQLKLVWWFPATPSPATYARPAHGRQTVTGGVVRDGGSQIHARFCIILWRNLYSADQKLFFSTTVHSLILSSTSQLPDDILNSEFTSRRSTRRLCEQAKQSVRSTSGQLCSEANYGLPICGVRYQSGWKTCYK